MLRLAQSSLLQRQAVVAAGWRALAAAAADTPAANITEQAAEQEPLGKHPLSTAIQRLEAAVTNPRSLPLEVLESNRQVGALL